MKKSEVKNKRSQSSEVLDGEAPSPAATVGAIGDRANVAAAACRLRSQDGSSTLIVHFYIANHRGDTVLVIGESGAAESHLRYDAFGNVTARSGSFTPSYAFSTKEHLPGANLYAYVYRVYDPHAGRWTQRDPIDYQDSINLYQFCGNNGVNTSDPDGRENYLTAADPEYAYNWDLNNRNTTFAGDAFNQRMAAMFKGATIAAVGVGAVALYGPAVLGYLKMKLAYALALLAGTAPRVGDKVYRVWGGLSQPWGSYWTKVNPAHISNYRSIAGLPSSNAGRFVSEGILKSINGVSVSTAKIIESGQIGGLQELIINSPQTAIELQRVSGVNPPF